MGNPSFYIGGNTHFLKKDYETEEEEKGSIRENGDKGEEEIGRSGDYIKRLFVIANFKRLCEP